MRFAEMIVAVLIVLAGPVMAADPFGVDARLVRLASDEVVQVSFRVPPGYHLYADTLSVTIQGGDRALSLVERPRPVSHHDSFSGAARDSYTNDFTMAYEVPVPGSSGTVVEVHYQGCSAELCFFPETRVFPLGSTTQVSEQAPSVGSEEGKGGWREWVDGFRVAGKTAGYLRTGDFMSFLDVCEGRHATPSGNAEGRWDRFRNAYSLFGADPVEFLRQFGAGWTLLVILIGGLLLNMTPCVLPMMPVNLAILGAGTQGVSRARGFLLGGVYGVGMALVYGILGLTVVLTGAQFGALNSLPGFNLAIAILFLVLGLAMFDVITIDLARFQGGAGGDSVFKRGGRAAALIMGSVAALLAGACVAPVVIAVLILSGTLYSQGAVIGLVLPFMLGVGMALPWPFAGGGLARLPKPGAWMTRVKYGFGVFIFLFALHYAVLAYHGWRGSSSLPAEVPGTVQVSPDREGGWAAALSASRRDGQPLLVDFWATWCKNCEAMEATTFRAKVVQRRLANYRVVKFQAEKPNDPATKEILDYFGVKGLPTYVVLMPPQAEAK
jgi:thiol:disulfide interchange protein